MILEERKKFFQLLKKNGSLADLEEIKVDFSKFETNKAKIVERISAQDSLDKYIYRVPLIPDDESTNHEWQKAYRDFTETIGLLETSFGFSTKELISLLMINGIDGFKNNKVTFNYNSKIKSGMKLTRTFRLLVIDPYWVEYIQTEYSRVTSSVVKMSGWLHLSVHPIDFITMSESGYRYKWRSCQSLDGDYASGTLSLMGDGCTLLAYVTGDEQEDIIGTGIKWWPKKWRALVHINPSGTKFIVNRHYPSHSYSNESSIIQEMQKIWSDKNLDNKTQLKRYLSDIQVPMSEVLVHVKDRIFYSDINSDFDPTIVFNQSVSTDEKIFIGVSVACCHCGKNSITESISFSCDDCHEKVEVCENCGDLFDPVNLLYHPDGGMICANCSIVLDEELFDRLQESTIT